VLEFVFLSKLLIPKVHLLIHTEEGNTYIGNLMFEKADSAKVVFEFLHGRRGKHLTAIGSIDVPIIGWIDPVHQAHITGKLCQLPNRSYGVAAGKSAALRWVHRWVHSHEGAPLRVLLDQG
jgi:hypothetical protein